MPVYKKYNGKPVVGYTASELGYTDPKLTEDETNPAKMFWSYQNSDGSRGEPLGLQGVNDMLGLMGYKEASELRKKSFSERFAENITAGGGIGESFKKTFSEKSKARAMGIKESFDPLNIVKKLTGGSRIAPAILGRLSGRSAEDIKYFAGDPKKRKQLSGGSENLEGAAQTLGSIYALMVKMEEEKKLVEEELARKQKTEQEIEDTRNKELIKALTGRRKTPKEKRKEEVKQKTEQRKEKVESKKEQKKTEQKQEQSEKKTERKKETAKKVEEAKKPEVVAPKEVKPPPTAKPEVVSKVPVKEVSKAAIPTAAKVAGAAAIVGGLLMPTETVAKDIDKASQEVGVDKSLMYAMAKQESGFNPSAAAKTSSAKGLYQFIKGTWDGMVKKYGTKYPILQERGPEDSYANALAGALYIKENSDYLSKFKIPINATTIYAAHFLGPGGAKTLLTADRNADAVELMPKAAASNDFIFYNKTNGRLDKTRPRTVQEVIDVLFQKVGQYQEKYATALGQVNSGNQISAASTENRELKKDMAADSAPATTIVNNNTTTQTKKQGSKTPVAGDDRSAYEKKVN